MNALCSILAVIIVVGSAIVGLHLLLGEYVWILYVAGAYFALMAGMSRLNAT